MNDSLRPKPPQKKTPADATPFEREQLRFFLSGGDLGATLSEANPSLAWLPVLFSEMKLIQNETQLVPWIERNFADADAVREIVANIHFFGPETATFLEYRLNAQADNLPPLFVKSWTLIIRHMRAARRGFPQNEWFQIAIQLKRGEYSGAVLERLANTLRPKPKIGTRLSWPDDTEKMPERPSDLMSIDFEVDDNMSSDDTLAAWPSDMVAEIDENVLLQLTTALSAALHDATDVGVEGQEGISTSDYDVPSVARHPQNEYRSGFQTIVRVMAEIWTRFVAKLPSRAISVAERWRDSHYRLMRRMAMFAFTNSSVPGKLGAGLLVDLPSEELFLTSSSVEVHQLIRARWTDFPPRKKQKILLRFCEGPPRNWFREGAEIDRQIDRCRFDNLSYMVDVGFSIGAEAKKLLMAIRTRWPQWQPKPTERAGFLIWQESGTCELGGDTDKFKGIKDSGLVAEAGRIAAAASFMGGDSWQDLCLSDPDRALRGLDADTTNGNWSPAYWEQLLLSRKAYADAGTELNIAKLLLEWPQDNFAKVSVAVSSWLDLHSKTLPDAQL
jgi:hypothetical protein